MALQTNFIAGSEVTIEGGMTYPILASNQDVINTHYTGNAGLNSIYTVPAGKRFYLMGFYLQGSAANNFSILSTGAGGVNRLVGLRCLANVGDAFSSATPIAVLDAGESIYEQTTNAVEGSFWGILETL